MVWQVSLSERGYPVFIDSNRPSHILISFISIVQSIATLILGSILGLVFIWKVGLVGVGECLRGFVRRYQGD